MKKLTSMLVALAVMLIAAVLFLPTEARAATEGYYTYTVSNGEATITSCSDTQGGDIEIPSTLGGYPVTSIGDGAFSDMGIGAVEIPDGVTSIGGGAFAENHNLLIVNIPDSVTSIGDFAFSGCNRLPEIIILTVSPALEMVRSLDATSCSKSSSRTVLPVLVIVCSLPAPV